MNDIVDMGQQSKVLVEAVPDVQGFYQLRLQGVEPSPVDTIASIRDYEGHARPLYFDKADLCVLAESIDTLMDEI